MGTKDYAKAVAREMDPEGSLFKERILSRDENGCKSRDLYMLFLYLFYTKV
jgi:TFIIF-interacting CTD phosphatase-like protein